ncbi:hypothetical protein B0H12DRAFT_1244234 [Mycena haematopus]|nr:hypothetical protein B0H12DRAFT_1244234 [Mycena haematopus]
MANSSKHRKRGKQLQQFNAAKAKLEDATPDSEDENISPTPLPHSNITKRSWKSVFSAQIAQQETEITEKNAYITKLHTLTSTLQTEVLQLRNDYRTLNESLTARNDSLTLQNTVLRSGNRSVANHKRKAAQAFGTELSRKQKCIKRLESERNEKAADMENLERTVEEQENLIRTLETALAAARATITQQSISFQLQLGAKQEILTTVQKALYDAQSCRKRASVKLREVKSAYKALKRWKPKNGNTYTPVARRLARELIQPVWKL